jgi:hypothetical protein
MAMFHKDNCRCCNKYIAHTICACKEQHVDLHMQDIGDTITMVCPKLMHDLESEASSSALADYKALVDEAASLRPHNPRSPVSATELIDGMKQSAISRARSRLSNILSRRHQQQHPRHGL